MARLLTGAESDIYYYMSYVCLPTLGSKSIVAITRWDSDLEAFSHKPSDGSFAPGNPGSPDWPSALRLVASSGFGSVCSSVTRIAFLPCAALRRSWEFRIRLPCGFRLLRPCMMSIIGCLQQRGSSLFYSPGFATRFSAVPGFSCVSLPIHILLPVP
jgi:hypothetical protein